MMLEGLTAVVTGASQGIGRVIAQTMAAEGATVTLAARGDGIHAVRDEIGEERSLAVETDVTDGEAVERCIDRTVEHFGGLDCVVNNAGIAGPTAPIEDITDDAWARTLDVNVVGMGRVVRHAVPHLRTSDRSSIVNISSMSGKRPLVNRTPYTASKMAVIGLTRTLAFELGDDDIRVNAICPGATHGPRIDSVIEKQAEQRDIDYAAAKQAVFTEETALGTLVDPEDTANLAVYLASEHGRHITAQDINVDGGATWY